MYENQASNLGTDYVGNELYISLHRKKKYLLFKRGFDVLASIITIPFITLIILITGIFIKIDSKGPIFYSQFRIGKDEKEFKIYKLRSMIVDAEKNVGSVWAQVDDPRVTNVGKIIRKLRIDELPQFVNVLKGDMSIIGPRPERKDLTEKFEQTIPGFKERLKIKPGITGLAQINGGYDILPEEKLKYDIDYIKSLGILTDVKIIIGTIRVIFTGHGAR